MNKKVPTPPLNDITGKAATSMSNKNFKKKFGQSSTRSGARGEKILVEKLRDWLPADVRLFCSLSVPGKSSDIDFACVAGDKVFLIDAKLYRQDGGWFWNSGDSKNIKRNFSTYKSSKGNPVKMSQSMAMARDIFEKKFPGYKIIPIVILTTDPNVRGAKTPHTRFLTFPGGVKAYNDRSGKRFLKRSTRGVKRTEKTYRMEKFLETIVQ